MPSRASLQELANRLRAAGFTVDGVTERLGVQAVEALARNVTIPARRALRNSDDELATLVRLLMLQQEVPRDAAARALGDLVPFLGADAAVPRSEAGGVSGVGGSPARGATQEGGSPERGTTRVGGSLERGSTQADGSPERGATRADGSPERGATQAGESPEPGATQEGGSPERGTTRVGGSLERGSTRADGSPERGATQAGESPERGPTQAGRSQVDARTAALAGRRPGRPGTRIDSGPPLLVPTSTGVRAALDLRPYAVEGLVDGWVVSDLIPTLDGRNAPPRADFVLGISPASTTLARLAVPGRVGRALDLGTGCGVQALHLAARAAHVVATDLNPRALALAEMTAALNGIDLDLREGSLYEPVADECFDLILTNPPYVISPPSDERLVYREGSLPADDLVRQVVSGAGTHLNPGGVLQVLANWAITDEPWPDRLAGWIRPTGCDALVLQRERLDPAEYVEIWLADAGLAASPDYARRYADWLDYFAALGITGVGMGWITLYNTGRDDPDLRLEEWPHRVQQPVGQAFADHPTAVTNSRTAAADLLAARWRLADDIVQETLGQPGAEDPEHIVLRSGTGFCRAHEVDTALGGVLGACDGELPLAELVGAVADLLGMDAAALTQDLLPRLRTVIADGMLHPA